MTEIAYERRYCLFFDVLGFKNKVKSNAAQNIYDVLQEIRKTHIYREVYGEYTSDSLFSSRKVTQFSDCIVVSYREGDFVGWMNIISDVFYLQLTLLRKGFLIRGAVTVGDMYHDEHYCFGPTLIEAAELEKLAMYPRVILTEKFARRSLFDNPTVNSDLAESRCINNMVDKDLDGVFYIDYFNVSPDDFDGRIDDLFGYLQNLKESIIDLGDASKNNINLRLKYSWMRKKFEDMMSSIYSNDVPNIQGQAVPSIFKGICSELRFTE